MVPIEIISYELNHILKGTKKGFRGLEELETLPRKNQAELDSSEKERFVSALKTIIKNGQYAEFVSIHTDAATYRIHTEWNDVETNKRFLPWHRVFLHELELETQ